jgi:hypothetical protein
MKKENKKLNIEKGSILAYVLVMMMIVSIILISMLQYISSQIQLGSHRLEKEKAFHVAEAGIYYYRWYLVHNVADKTVAQIKSFWEDSPRPMGVNSAVEVEFADPEGGPIGKYRIEVTPPIAGSTIATVKSTGWTYKEPNVKRVVQARFRRKSWSEYIFLLDESINFGVGAVVDGRVHSNKGVRFDGVANNEITSYLDKYDDPSHDDVDSPEHSFHADIKNEFGVHTHVATKDPLPPASVPERPDVFAGGRNFPTDEKSVSDVSVVLGDMKIESQVSGHGLYLDGTACGGVASIGWHLILNGGTVTAKKVTSKSATTHAITGEGCSVSYSGAAFPNNGIIYAEGHIWVEGIVNNKKVTIVAGAAGKNIYIGAGNTNIKYTNFDGTDTIGLIAQDSIIVARDCPTNFIVNAALLAQSGNVRRDSYTSSYNKTSLTIKGSIASHLATYFNHGSNGFSSRNYKFDDNLIEYPPPYFPTGTEYEIDRWEEL